MSYPSDCSAQADVPLGTLSEAAEAKKERKSAQPAKEGQA